MKSPVRLSDLGPVARMDTMRLSRGQRELVLEATLKAMTLHEIASKKIQASRSLGFTILYGFPIKDGRAVIT